MNSWRTTARVSKFLWHFKSTALKEWRMPVHFFTVFKRRTMNGINGVELFGDLKTFPLLLSGSSPAKMFYITSSDILSFSGQWWKNFLQNENDKHLFKINFVPKAFAWTGNNSHWKWLANCNRHRFDTQRIRKNESQTNLFLISDLFYLFVFSHAKLCTYK